MNTNSIEKPKSIPVNETEKQSMNLITNRIVQMIKDKHLPKS
jgi:hypothetical protein